MKQREEEEEEAEETEKEKWKLTSLFNAAVAVRRSAGSIARRVSIRGNADGGKFLNVSLMHLL